ncbi:MAG: hypothetical protein NTV76_11150 [Pseudomonas sp.]|nr:hypothetical protein [Pseudomonas sp.]
MSLFGNKAIVLLLAAAASFGAMSVYAATQPAAKTSTEQKVSTLDGKFTINLPQGFEANPLPPGDSASGTAGAMGTMYTNRTSKTVVLVAENVRTDGVQTKDNDSTFLDSAVESFLQKQSAALPDFKKLDEKKLTIKGLGLRQIESAATMGGGNTLDTTLLAGSGSRILVIQIISRADDPTGHSALVKQIIGGK